MFSETRVPADDVPLCVDLDGTLICTDSLHEAILLLVKASPFTAFRLPFWLLRGKIALKQEVASRVTLDPATLPYRDELLDYLRAERTKGRRLLLVSAAHESIVRGVACHLGIFDDVIGTDAVQNLKGANKRDALAARFGAGGYDYAGDDRADVPVWEAARGAIVVGNDAGLARRAGPRVQRVFTSPPRRGATLARALRVQQWVKNLLVFVPLLMAPEARDLPLFFDAFLAFVAFSLSASAVYVLNDLLDLAADRRHATKRLRPFASGDLSLATGFALVPVCLAAGFVITHWLPSAFLAVLVVYLLATTAYSFRLKYVPLVDVIVLAMLYVGRVIAGAAATHVWPSPWILGFSLFFFLSLAFVKRYAELYAMRAEPPDVRVRGYYPADLQLVAINGAVSGYISVLVAALYINSDRVTGVYARPELLWLICPLLLYWISRMWMLAHRGELHDDPVLFAIKDRESWVVGLLIAVVLLLARL